MKSSISILDNWLLRSLPLVGVWIEISTYFFIRKVPLRHSPWWECGLKSGLIHNSKLFHPSLPLVGVWIEILTRWQQYYLANVTPLGGSVD